MDASRSTRSSSRRSSILKPPKPRHPLQNLNFNSSSNENSPATTTKIKRRVSFAEKKHVKEFCNSLEQGTVWDNTYEEHDLSSLKLSCNSNQEECEVKSVFKGSIVGSLEEKEVQLDCNKVNEEEQEDPRDRVIHVASIVDDIEYQREMVLEDEPISPVKIQLRRSSISKSIIVYEDEDAKLPERVSNALKSNENYCSNSKLNATSVNDTCMDFTEVIYNDIHTNKINVESNETEQADNNVTMEFTQAALPSRNIQNCYNDPLDQDTSMTMTVAVPSVLKPNQIDNTEAAAYFTDDKTKNLDSPMDTTAVVSHILCDAQMNINKSETSLSMEITQAALPSLNVQNFHNDLLDQETSMTMTVAVPSLLKTNKIDNTETASCFTDDKTKNFDTLMETTAVVSNILYNTNINEPEYNNDRAIDSHDTSMEITKAVKTYIHELSDKVAAVKKISQNKYDTKNSDEKTKVLNISMEMTTPVPINVHSVTKNQGTDRNNVTENRFKKIRYDSDAYEITESVNRTRSCINEDMEFTVPIMVSRKVSQDNLEDSVSNTCCTISGIPSPVLNKYNSDNANRTNIFQNSSMTMTKVIPSLITPVHIQESGTTMVFPNTSMETTEAIVTSQPCSEIETAAQSNEAGQSISFGNVENEGLPRNTSTCTEMHSNATFHSLKSVTTLNKENCAVNSSLERFEYSATEESNSIEDRTSANSKPSMVLHESMQLNTHASAFKENNTETACSITNFSNIELHKTECLQNTEPPSRRTYTIQPINNDHTCSTNNENSSASAALNDTSDIFPLKNLEELESIKPPSFVCLDDISESDMLMNVTNNQEIISEKNYLVENDTEHEGSLLEEPVRKSQTFLIKPASVSNQSDNSLLGHKNQEQVNEIENLKLEAGKSSTEIHVLECSSSAMNSTKKNSVCDKEDNSENLLSENSDLESQGKECSLANIEDIDRDVAKTECDKKLIDVDRTKDSSEDYTSEKLKSNLEINSSSLEKSNSVEIDRFKTLMTELKICSTRDEIIWEVYHENIERNILVIGFISCSLLVAIYLQDSCEITPNQYLREIRIISRLADDADSLISMIHRLILEKVNIQEFLELYKNRADIFPMLEHISKEVKLAMDFMFELKRLNDLNLMEITCDSISFVSRSKSNDIIVKITINVKPFDKIESQDISVHCLLGSVRVEDIKKLITNVKRDHKFLRRYINDVKDYIYLMEESLLIKRSY